MRKRNATVTIALLFTAAAVYTLLLVFSPFLHNHKIDSDQHSDCPVCMLGLMTPASVAIAGCIVTILTFVEKFLVSSQKLVSAVCIFSQSARSPPGIFPF